MGDFKKQTQGKFFTFKHVLLEHMLFQRIRQHMSCYFNFS